MVNVSTLAAAIIESVPHEPACNSHQLLAINASKKSSLANMITRLTELDENGRSTFLVSWLLWGGCVKKVGSTKFVFA